MLRQFIVKMSVLGYFPLLISKKLVNTNNFRIYIYIYIYIYMIELKFKVYIRGKVYITLTCHVCSSDTTIHLSPNIPLIRQW